MINEEKVNMFTSSFGIACKVAGCRPAALLAKHVPIAKNDRMVVDAFLSGPIRALIERDLEIRLSQEVLEMLEDNQAIPGSIGNARRQSGHPGKYWK
ncbi:hypothetical protein TNCV_2794121 [Trichonephila clavipes]|nr:hypothetical protein TNCV_2794121 [Trichonephila clavipes]